MYVAAAAVATYMLMEYAREEGEYVGRYACTLEEEGEEAEGRGAAYRQHPGQALKRHQIPLSIEGPVCV